jgi:hypothetical protein
MGKRVYYRYIGSCWSFAPTYDPVIIEIIIRAGHQVRLPVFWEVFFNFWWDIEQVPFDLAAPRTVVFWEYLRRGRMGRAFNRRIQNGVDVAVTGKTVSGDLRFN